ncbi:unnamed protein product, partial [Bubo scandiacus]
MGTGNRDWNRERGQGKEKGARNRDRVQGWRQGTGTGMGTEAGTEMGTPALQPRPSQALGAGGRETKAVTLLCRPAGYLQHCLAPAGYDTDKKQGLPPPPPDPAYAPGHEEYSDPESPQSSFSARYFNGEAAVTDSYSMDAFFITDGRSRRRSESQRRGSHRHSLPRVWQDLCHLLQPQPAQADPPQPGQQDGEEMSHLRQGLRLHARPGHARPHPQPQAQVRRVRQSLQPAVAAAGPHALAHWGEALRLLPLRQSLRRSLQPARPHADPLRLQALQVQAVREDLRPQVVPQQALRVRLLQGLRTQLCNREL